MLRFKKEKLYFLLRLGLSVENCIVQYKARPLQLCIDPHSAQFFTAASSKLCPELFTSIVV
jgi:hypothetical protein